jgi:hypothetical protein
MPERRLFATNGLDERALTRVEHVTCKVHGILDGDGERLQAHGGARA